MSTSVTSSISASAIRSTTGSFRFARSLPKRFQALVFRLGDTSPSASQQNTTVRGIFVDMYVLLTQLSVLGTEPKEPLALNLGAHQSNDGFKGRRSRPTLGKSRGIGLLDSLELLAYSTRHAPENLSHRQHSHASRRRSVNRSGLGHLLGNLGNQAFLSSQVVAMPDG